MTKRHAIKAPSLPTLLRGAAAQHTDGEGLFLATTGAPKRTGSWKFAYTSPVTGKRTKTTLGSCFLATDGETVKGMTITLAREAHQKAREAILRGIDPNMERDEQKQALQAQHAAEKQAAADKREAELEAARCKKLGKAIKDSFRDAFERWQDDIRKNRDPKTLLNQKQIMVRHAFPLFGDKHCDAVTEDDISDMDLAGKNTPWVLQKARTICSDVFTWAAHAHQKRLRVQPNPVFPWKDHIDNAPDHKPHAAYTEPEDIRELMLSILHTPLYHSNPAYVETLKTTHAALRFIAMCGQRSHNVTWARKEHFDLGTATWTIPAIDMKGKTINKRRTSAKAHVVYLSRQAVELLREQFARFPDNQWVFPSEFTNDGAMVRTGMYDRLVDLGFMGKHTVHGFRATMRTAGEDYAGLNGIVLETMLGHKAAKDGVEKHSETLRMLQKMLDGGMGETYKRQTKAVRSVWETKAREVVQGWSDWLDLIASDAWREENPLEEASNEARIKQPLALVA